jgi:hypothetical protein
MARTQAPIFDAYTPLDYKQAMGGRTIDSRWLAPTWVGTEHRRRLQAYMILQSYQDNASRFFLDDRKVDAEDRREYGDAALLVNTVLAALLGDKQEIHVDGADESNPDSADTVAVERQELLREWAVQERYGLKLIETERNAVGLGDGVYVLGWDTKKNRPRLKIYDPGFYFPVLDDEQDEEFPTRVHIAWELPDDDKQQKRVRRITYDLVDVKPYTVPWSTEKATVECYLTDGTWTMDDTTRGIDDFDNQHVVYRSMVDKSGNEVEMRDLPLGFDFIPVVHVPNTVSLLNHFGTSSITRVLQVLDDVQAADTDTQASAATTGGMVLALSGTMMPPDNVTYGPKTVFKLGLDGKLTALDTSTGLKALQEYRGDLRKVLSVSARVPESALGRIDPGEIASGILLALSNTPMSAMIDEMRLVRDEKDGILFKFVQRLFMYGGAITSGDVMDATLARGSYLPTDEQSTASTVVQLLGGKPALSLETGLRMLVDAGIPIENIAEEIDRIKAADFTGANELFQAVGDEQAVGDYLGIKVKLPEPPPVVLPDAPPKPAE